MLAMLSGLMLALLLFAGPAAGQNTPAYDVQPAPGSQTSPGGDYFVIETAAGAESRHEFVIKNRSQSPISLRLAAVDAETGPMGGVSYEIESDSRDATGGWIALDASRADLPASGSQTVGFRVGVPAGARPGQYLGAISVAAIEEEDSGNISVRTRRVVAVQLELPGGSAPLLVISGVVPLPRPDGTYLGIRITSIGQRMTKGRGFIDLPGQGFQREFDLDTFVPATSITYPIEYDGPPLPTRPPGHAEIRYDGLVAVWDGLVGAPATSSSMTTSPPPSAGLEIDDADVASLPLIPIIVAAVGILAGSIFLVYLLFARRRDEGGSPGDR